MTELVGKFMILQGQCQFKQGNITNNNSNTNLIDDSKLVDNENEISD